MKLKFDIMMLVWWLTLTSGICLGANLVRLVRPECDHEGIPEAPVRPYESGTVLKHKLVPEIRAVVLSNGKFWIDGGGKMSATVEGKRNQYWTSDEDPVLWETISGW